MSSEYTQRLRPRNSRDAVGGQGLSAYYSTTDANGAAKPEVVLQSALAGSYVITVKGETSGLSASAPINIGPGISVYTPGRQLGQSNPGGQITVEGGSFHANEQVNVYFQTEKNGVTTVTTDTNGAFLTTITVPLHYTPTTTYYVYAKNADGTLHTRTKFTYVIPATDYYNNGGRGAAGLIVVDGFGANETLQIVDRYQQTNQVNVSTFTVDATGFGEFVVHWPSTAHNAANKVAFAVIGQSSQLTASDTHSLDAVLVVQDSYKTFANGNAEDTLPLLALDFAAGEQVQITFNDKIIYTGTSDENGAVSASVVIPTLEEVSSGPGNIQVRATGLSSNLTSNTYPWEAFDFNYQPTMTITPTSGPSGTMITVTGSHFPTNTSIGIGWDGPFTPDPMKVGSYPE